MKAKNIFLLFIEAMLKKTKNKKRLDTTRLFKRGGTFS